MTRELFRKEPYLQSCEARVLRCDRRGLGLDRTIFYPESGGQPGDTGTVILSDGASIRVVDTIRHPVTGQHIHVLEPGFEELPPGTTVTAQIDWDRRYRHMRMHSCLHLLCAVVPGGVSGCQISAEKGRMDFDLENVKLDKQQIEQDLNRLIQEDRKIGYRFITEEELAEKPDLVRTLRVRPPTCDGSVRVIEIESIDAQPCGGTHVASTAEIGPVRIGKIENKGKHNRRINVHFIE